MGVLASVGTVIVLGLRNFDAALITFPHDAFHLDKTFLTGLGAATSVAVYDYLGYYNICHLGEEVRAPTKTIPRAVLLSIVIVAAIYMLDEPGVHGRRAVARDRERGHARQQEHCRPRS